MATRLTLWNTASDRRNGDKRIATNCVSIVAGPPMSAPDFDRQTSGEAQTPRANGRLIRTVLFLDFDGVLHPNDVYLEKRRPVLRAEGELFMWAPSLVDALKCYPHVQIVLSTSWSRVFGFERAKNALPTALRERVVGATWHSQMGRCQLGGMKLQYSWWDEASRFEQILRYVDRARSLRWVAIDDQGQSWPPKYMKNLILTDPTRGIADPRALSQLHARLAAL